MSKLRLIELFSGIGAQASALERLGVDFEHWITSEWEVNAVASYNAIHIKDYTDYSKTLTTEWLAKYLHNIGVSTDGKKPMTLQQIERKGEKWLRETYSNFIATCNIGSIVSAHGSDLAIEDTDKYTYLLTYSFPCQDLSVAGNQAGMTKGSGTRSGLLWEVERLLNECEELPQYFTLTVLRKPLYVVVLTLVVFREYLRVFSITLTAGLLKEGDDLFFSTTLKYLSITG